LIIIIINNHNLLYFNTFIIFKANFKEMCIFESKLNEHFGIMFQNKTNYTNWSIQNQLIELCAKKVQNIIFNEIKDCGYFSVMCDEAR